VDLAMVINSLFWYMIRNPSAKMDHTTQRAGTQDEADL
jgi:hypothetical protein